MEIISKYTVSSPIKSVLFDFDGTLSVIREGWPEVMIPYFVEELSEAATTETPEEVSSVVKAFVDILTGKDTIFQCMALAEEVEKRGGKPKDPKDYKKEYLRRLMVRIHDRLEALRDGKVAPEQMTMEGTFQLLDALKARGVEMYLASGTDQPDVANEAHLLGVDSYFGDRIFGALEDWTVRSKATVVKSILSTHNLSGSSLATFGDGFVEIECCKAVGGVGIGVASDEAKRQGMNEWKRNRLIAAGADIIITDYLELGAILDYLKLGG